jgi:transposase
MNRLKKVEKYSILWLNNQSYDTKEIANELNLPEKTVVSFLEKNQETGENKIKTATSSAGKIRNKNLMITETVGKKNRGVTVMTPEASMLGDSTKKQNQKQVHRDNKSAIFKPINNE